MTSEEMDRMKYLLTKYGGLSCFEVMERLEAAEAMLKWIDANRMILSIVLRPCDGLFLPTEAIAQRMELDALEAAAKGAK